MTDKSNLLQIYLQEYQALKAEQLARIGFRDNLLYVTIAVFGGILSFTLANKNYYALIIVPWVCLILGWTYLVNDEKISALGHYIRHDLTDRVSGLASQPSISSIFDWEIAHRSDKDRKRRKLQQLIIDQITFVISGAISLVAFWILVPHISVGLWILSISELSLILILGIEISHYADLGKGK